MAATRKREADPATQLRQLEQELARAEPVRAYVLRGEESWFRERGVALLLDAARRRGFEVTRHDGKDPELRLASLLDDLAGAPLFASARCVVVRNADPLLKKTGGDPAPLTRAALAFLKSEREGMLVFGAGALRADHALAKAVAAAGGRSVSCRKLWDTPPHWDPDPRKSELVQWLLARARERQVRLVAEDAVYLAAATGNDLSALDGQLEKLRHGGRRAVRELIGWESGGSPWEVADELLCGDAARGLAAVEALFSAGFRDSRDGRREMSPVALTNILLGSLRSKARQLLIGSRALATGHPMPEAAERAGVGKGERARVQFQRNVGTRPPRAWRRVWEDIGELERKSRTAAVIDAVDFARLALRWRSRRS